MSDTYDHESDRVLAAPHRNADPPPGPTDFSAWLRGEAAALRPAGQLFYADPGLTIWGEPPQVAEMFSSLARAQSRFPTIQKNRVVEVKKGGQLLYRFRYAELGPIQEATRPHLTAEGLSVMQPFSRVASESMSLRTIVAHANGAMMVSTVKLAWNPSIRDAGADLTYMQRYAYSKAFSLATDEDAEERAKEGEQVEAKEEGGKISADLSGAISSECQRLGLGNKALGELIRTRLEATTDEVLRSTKKATALLKTLKSMEAP